MSITISGEIGYSTRSNTAYLIPTGTKPDGKRFSEPAVRDTVSSSPWADWGSDNQLPISMAKDIEECGVLNAALDAKARIAVGKGPQPFLVKNIDAEGKEELEYVKDPEIHDWMEMNESYGYSINSCFDLFGYGWNASQIILSRDRSKINRIRRTDIVEARLEKKDKKTGNIANIYLSADWSCPTQSESEYLRKIPLLDECMELEDLAARTSAYEFAIINRQLRNGRQYYPLALWYSTKKWVDIAKAVPGMKTAMFNNQMTIKYLVTISINYWKRIHKKWDSFTSEKQKEIMESKLEEIDKYLAGNENQYKSVFANSYIDPITKQEVADIKIDVLDDKVKDGKLLPDSAAANSEILFALMINPALFGAGQPQGAYASNAGGSNIRESYMVQLMLLEWERRQNLKSLNIVKKYNGWSQRLETDGSRLVFRYPSNLLTTLDTGKSTKPEVL